MCTTTDSKFSSFFSYKIKSASAIHYYPFEVGLKLLKGEGLEEHLNAQVLEVIGLQSW